MHGMGAAHDAGHPAARARSLGVVRFVLDIAFSLRRRSSAGTPEWADLYRRRTSVEREFGRLNREYGLAFLRVRGIERVRLHADLIMLARLATALSRVRDG
jgi:hypothetical protein